MPALRVYDRRGFAIVPDWIGYNDQRFLLYKPLNGAPPELPPEIRKRDAVLAQ